MTDSPAWMEIARAELGVHETPGAQHTARILEYHETTKLKATDDETSWCSAFANWCMEQAGIKGTNSAAARSWLTWGQEDAGRPGAVVVLWRGKPDGWQGHVGFLDHATADRVYLLGGNQGDAVSIMGFPKSRVLGYRWPAAD